MILLATTATLRLFRTMIGAQPAPSLKKLAFGWTMIALATFSTVLINLTICKANSSSIIPHCQATVHHRICPSLQWCLSGLSLTWPTTSSTWQSIADWPVSCSYSSYLARSTSTASWGGTPTRKRPNWVKNTLMCIRGATTWLASFCPKQNENKNLQQYPLRPDTILAHSHSILLTI